MLATRLTIHFLFTLIFSSGVFAHEGEVHPVAPAGTLGSALLSLTDVDPSMRFHSSSGVFSTTQAGLAKGINISGRSSMLRSNYREPKTSVRIMAMGLAPNTKYGVHLHNAPCSLGGGAHYKIDTAVPTAILENEFWPEIQTNEEGSGRGQDSKAHFTRADAQSIVIHDADGSRIACSDLVGAQFFSTEGRFELTEIGKTRIADFRGSARMIRQNGETRVDVGVSGLLASTAYPIHVHVDVCANGGGAHYKLDPNVAETIAANEIWPLVTTGAEGRGRGKAMVTQIARVEARSIVIHDPVDKAKLACVDLK